MLSANFKPKRAAATSRGFLATAWLSCCYHQSAMPPIATDVSACGSSLCLSVCTSGTLVHPAKAVGRNEMPFGRDTCLRRGEICGSKPQSPRSAIENSKHLCYIVFARCQWRCVAAIPPIGKLRWPLNELSKWIYKAHNVGDWPAELLVFVFLT